MSLRDSWLARALGFSKAHSNGRDRETDSDESDELPPCDHVWRTRRVGGPPDDAGSYDLVTLCENCGEERSEDR